MSNSTLTPTRPSTTPEGQGKPPRADLLVTIGLVLSLVEQVDRLGDRPVGHALIQGVRVAVPWVWHGLVMLWRLIFG